MSAPVCPKCGKQMELVPWSEWTLHDRRIIDAICPECLHVERIERSGCDGPCGSYSPKEL